MCKYFLWLVFLLVAVAPVYAIEFIIADPLVADQEIVLSASLSATTNYYLQATLRSQSSSKYFGETKNNLGDWIDYQSSPEKEYIVSNYFVTDIQNSSWSGTIRLRFKADDPNYLGPGLYDLKLRRYTGASSSSAGDSNILTLNLVTNLPSSPSPQPTPTPSPSPTATPVPFSTKTPVPSVVLQDVVGSPSVHPLSSISTGTVAGQAVEIDLSGFGIPPSPSVAPSLPAQADHTSIGRPVLNKSRAKTALLLGTGMLIISISSFYGYRKYRSLYNRKE